MSYLLEAEADNLEDDPAAGDSLERLLGKCITKVGEAAEAAAGKLPLVGGTMTGAIAHSTAAAAAGTLRGLSGRLIGRDIHWEGATATTANISGTAAAYVSSGASLTITHAASTAGASRAHNFAGTGAQKNFVLPGGIGNAAMSAPIVNWNRPWRVTIFMAAYMGSTSTDNKVTFQFGVVSTHATHTLPNNACVGFRLTAGASGTTATVIANTGSGELTSDATTLLSNTDTDLKTWELLFIPGSGLYLYCDGTLYASLGSGSIPSGSGSSGNVAVQIVSQEGAGNSNGCTFAVQAMQITHLNG